MWWKYFNPCAGNQVSENKMKSYCDSLSTILTEIPINFTPRNLSLPMIQSKFGTSYLYCKWKFINDDPSKSILFYYSAKIRKARMVAALVLTFSDSRSIFHNIDRDTFVWESEDIISFTFHYYTENGYSEVPFNMILDYQSSYSKNYTGLFISIGVIILSCLICSLCFYKCSRMVAQNARRLNQRRNGPGAIELMNNNGVPNPNFNSNINQIVLQELGQNAQAEILLKRKNKEIIEKMLDNELKPIAYKDILNEYNSSCTICIEGFIIDQVDVTVLNCKHIFHHKCLKDWLYKNLINPKCPNCNYNVIDKNFPSNEIKAVPISDSTDRRLQSPDTTRTNLEILNNNNIRVHSFQNLDRLHNN